MKVGILKTLISLTIAIVSFSCSRNSKKEVNDEVLFELLKSSDTGVDFENILTPTEQLNIMTYLYYFNGGGVASGDFNQDGLIDLFFVGNLCSNKMYLNEGNFKFKDITESANVNGKKSWSTGVSVIDINNDGLLDLYICQVGSLKNLQGQNQLFVCEGIRNGVPIYKEQAQEYNLNISALATQAAFFDFDLDGDLDLYLLCHSVHENGTYGKRSSYIGTFHDSAGDKFFRNEDGKFVESTKDTGIQGMVIGYGLGIAVGDVNGDFWPDIYIGNDFHENDYLYINQRDGTFKESINDFMNHTSKFSMGVDIADINNDGAQDVISVDMHPFDPVILKKSLGEEDNTSFNFKLTYGYNLQFARNCLQLNNGNNTFSEIGMFSGVYATDWSWAPLFFDFDNDGFKDLFVSNGIVARMNDIDYVNFRDKGVEEPVTAKMKLTNLQIAQRIPTAKIPNQIFRNNGNLQYQNVSDAVAGQVNTFSNGAIYVDLNNDGYLDIVTNNINSTASIYRNKANKLKETNNNFLSLKLVGSAKNIDGIGSRVLVFKDKTVIHYEKFPVRGFMSSMNQNLLVGLGDTLGIDSIYVIWPDLRFQKLEKVLFNKVTKVVWEKNLAFLPMKSMFSKEQSEFEVNDFILNHKENDFVEFDRERLIPFMVSREGPAIEVADVNGDGLDDIFFGSSKRKRSAVYFQTQNGEFVLSSQSQIYLDSMYEDVDAEFADIDNDNDKDLVIASGGNEFWGDSEYLKQRFYLNDGKGNFSNRSFFPNCLITASKIIATDFDKDGIVDFFIAGRAVPKSYGLPSSSFLFKGLGNGSFLDVTKIAIEGNVDGMITDAVWTDIDSDHDPDLLLAYEWGQIVLCINNKGKFTKSRISVETGLWSSVFAFDFDQDGDVDIVAGNHGLNSKIKASKDNPVKLMVNDFDGNGQTEQILTYFVGNREVPFATHAELMKQIPMLKKNYLLANDFADASISELFGSKKIEESIIYEVTNLANCYFENQGQNDFKVRELPANLQFSTLRAANIISIDSVSSKVFLGGNSSSNSVDMGFFDADFGNILSISRDGQFSTVSLAIKGDIVSICPIKIGGNLEFIVDRNNASALILTRKKNLGEVKK